MALQRWVSIPAGPLVPLWAPLLSLTDQPDCPLYLPPLRLQLLSPLILFCHYTLSQRIGPTQVCPWGLVVYSLSPLLSPLLSFALPLWTPERALLIEAGTPATSCSAAPADNWTRRSQITLFSSSTLHSPPPLLPSLLQMSHRGLLWSSTCSNHLLDTVLNNQCQPSPRSPPLPFTVTNQLNGRMGMKIGKEVLKSKFN